MSFRPALFALGLLAILAGCDVGTSESGVTKISSFTASFPDGDGCAVRGDGSVLCRGGNDYGRLGIGTAAEGTYDPANTVAVDASVRFSAVSMDGAHACALDGAGAAWCWGLNHRGQLGSGDTTGTERCDATLSYYPTVITGTYPCATRPVRVQTDRRFKSISVDGNESCGLTSGGELWCWGEGDDGFGLGAAGLPAACSSGYCTTPIRAAPGLTFRKVTGVGSGTCGVAPDFQLYCWGQDYYGRFGRDTASTALWNAPTPINSSAAIRDVATAADHTCTITTAGALMCFGNNYSGQLGDGTNIARVTPLQVDPPVPFTRIAVASGVSCALDAADHAWCWGANGSGRLGLGNVLPALSPAPVLGALTFQKISVAGQVCGTGSGGIWCWGQLPSRFEQ